MTAHAFDPARADAWLAHGRSHEHAAILADAWRRFPDLPPACAPDARLARMRERVIALRPVMEAMTRAAEDERQARNFAFTETRLASGAGDDRDRAILRARTVHGYDWDRAVRYASGWYAADAGWEPEPRRPGAPIPATLAYDQGFAEGGGNRDDLFDTARRAFEAAVPLEPPLILATGRPRPSDWPKPTDGPLPARWKRRLLILGAPEAGLIQCAAAVPSGSALLLPMLQACQGHEELTVIVVASGGFHALDGPGSWADAVSFDRPGTDRALAAQLRGLVGTGDFDDVLVAAQGTYLALLDASAAALPLCRTMERTRNTVLQQRAHFRIWLDRGISAGESVGAGHIRWGKAIKGLTGRLGEFTARYAGKNPSGGHRIVIETAEGRPAMGYVSVKGEPLDPELVIGNRAHLRKAMAVRLRAFGGATQLSAAPSADRPASL